MFSCCLWLASFIHIACIEAFLFFNNKIHVCSWLKFFLISKWIHSLIISSSLLFLSNYKLRLNNHVLLIHVKFFLLHALTLLNKWTTFSVQRWLCRGWLYLIPFEIKGLISIYDGTFRTLKTNCALISFTMKHFLLWWMRCFRWSNP